MQITSPFFAPYRQKKEDFFMSEKKVGKRLLTWVLVLVMTLSLLPLNVLADVIPETDNTPDKVTATKSCTTEPDSNGNYTITLTVQGNPVPSTDTMTTPANADVVLVVDNSGSMSSRVGYPCSTPKDHFQSTGGDKFIALRWKIFTCPECGAKYYQWQFLVLGTWTDISDGVPDTCTGEKGETVRIDAAKAVSKAFADSILKGNGNKIAIIGFAHGDRDGGIDSKAIKVSQELTNDPAAVKTAINEMKADGGTNYTAALQKAYDYLNDRSDKDGRPGYVIFISDGAPGLSGESQNDPNWNGSNQAASIKNARYTLYTVGIALKGPAETYLKNMASADQNEHFINVTGADYEAQLRNTLQEWANKITQTPTTKPAGTNAVLTDVINTKQFEYVEGSATRGLTVGEDSEGNKTVMWEIGNIPEDEARVSFMIKAKDGVYGKDIPTNENVYLTYTDANGDDASMGEAQIGKPMVTIAAPTFTVTYNANGGSGTAPVDSSSPYEINSEVTILGQGDLTMEGHNFTGWNTEADGTGKSYAAGAKIEKLTENVILYAQWTKQKFTVTWMNGTTQLKKDENVEYGTAPAYNGNDPTKAEDENNTYTFLGWNTDQNATTKLETLPNVTTDVTYYAIFSATAIPKYTLTYDANGGTNAPAKVTNNKGGDTVYLDYSNQPTHAQQDGKNVIFIGWTNTDTDKKVYTNGESLPNLMMQATFASSDITVHAVWGLDDNGNGVPDALEAKVTYKVENGHWFDAATGQAAGSEIVCLRPLYKKSASDVWEPCNATLGDSIPTGRAGNAGYTADGWYKDAGTTKTDIDASTPVTGDVTYTFKYVPVTKPDTYTVVLHLDGGTYTTAPEYTPTADGYQYCLSKATEKVNPTITTLNKNGYQFKGWSLSETAPQALIGADETFASLSVQQNVLNGNHGKIDLYAVWQEIKYTVTYNLDGGTTTSKETTFSDLIYGIKTPTIKEPSKAGYTFAGWEPKVADTVTKDVTYKAKWNAIYVPYYPPVPPTVKIEDDDALGLNTTDHFAYIVGYGNGEVRPQNNITRAEVATIFFRLLTDDVRDENLTKTNRYSDVAATSWYNTAVSTLSSMGIITGYPDGTFRPNAAITRAEFAAIAARFDNDGDKTAAKFSDIATHWAKDEISIAYNNGWITGYPNGTFGPQRDITRAETMTLVNRVLNRQPETEDDLLPNMTVWTDNANPKAWYYLAVQEATNSHYYEFKTNSQYEKWTELRETRDWKALEQ